MSQTTSYSKEENENKITDSKSRQLASDVGRWGYDSGQPSIDAAIKNLNDNLNDKLNGKSIPYRKRIYLQEKELERKIEDVCTAKTRVRLLATYDAELEQLYVALEEHRQAPVYTKLREKSFGTPVKMMILASFLVGGVTSVLLIAPERARALFEETASADVQLNSSM